MNWTPISSGRLPDSGWYLVTWRSDDGRLSVENSEYARGHGFSDRWASNAEPIAWMRLPKPYKRRTP